MQKRTELKIIIIGPQASGKTSLVIRTLTNQFEISYRATIGVDFYCKTLPLTYKGEQVTILLQMWDLSGQDSCATLVRAFTKNTDGCLMVGDLSEPGIIKQKLQLWKKEHDEKCQGTPIVLCLNKCDIASDEINNKIKGQFVDWNFNDIFLTSALQGTGINEAIECLVTHIFRLKIEQSTKSLKYCDVCLTKNK